MKYLSDYLNDKQTELFNKYGAFFAFSNKQFEEKKKEGVIYQSLGQGLIAPKGTGAAIFEGLDAIHKEAIKQDIAENGIKSIIHRELANHECQITGDYSEVVDKLEPYGITGDQVRSEWPGYWDICVENDYF